MSLPFSLDFDALNDHAKKVEQLAGDVAASAAGAGGLSGEAFGSLGSFLVGSVDSVCGALRESCAKAGESFYETASELRGVAADVQELEYEIVAQLREFGLM